MDGQLDLPFDFPELNPPVIVYPHFERPKTDNERLLEFQYQYRVEGKESALREFLELSQTIALKMISKEAKKNKHLRSIPLWLRQEKAYDIAVYFFEMYKKKSSWMIEKNYPGYIYLRVLKSLYGRSPNEKNLDIMYVDIETFFNLGTEDEPEWGGDYRII